MVRPESELAEVAVEMLRADANVHSVDSILEDIPDRPNLIGMVRSVIPAVAIGLFLRTGALGGYRDIRKSTAKRQMSPF